MQIYCTTSFLEDKKSFGIDSEMIEEGRQFNTCPASQVKKT